MDSDIIIYILAAIGLIISAVAKNTKKKTEQARRLHKPDDGDTNYGDYHMPEPEEVRYPWDDDPSPPAHAKTHWSYDQETIKSHESSLRVDDMNRKPKNNWKITNNALDQPVDQLVPEASHKHSSLHFNLRDAIIYSELLKPKHEEY